MRTEVSTHMIDHYRENGFVVVPRLLDADEIAAWRSTIDEAVAVREELGRADADDARAPEDAGYYARIFAQHINLWQTHEPTRALMFDPRLGRLVADVGGLGGVRIWHDQALIKNPYANPTAFHLDVPYWSFTSPDALSIWIALDDATLENGCLHYVPGSHRAGTYDNVAITKDLGALFDAYPDWRSVAPVPCPIPAGSALIHNGLTFHGAGANMTPHRRRAMTCAYMPDGSTFNGRANILPDSYLRTLQVGDLLDDDRHTPLIYRRSADSRGRAAFDE